MARWWSSSASDRLTRIALAMLLPVAMTACGRGGSSPGDTAVPPVADDGAPAGTLPTPTAAPGAAVTGMPTQPPPPSAAPAEPAAAPVDATAAVDTTAVPDALPAPVDESALADAPPTSGAPTGTAAPATAPALVPADIAAAAAVVNQYMAALGADAPARAQGLWTTTPNDSAISQIARGPAFNVGVGSPAADAAGRVTVPVDVRGNADDGSDVHMQAVYTMQRSPAGAWRITSATVRDATP